MTVNRREFLTGCGSALGLALIGADLHAQSPRTAGFRLTDVTASSGLQFRHYNGAYGGKLLPETLGSGCAFLDYDNDGRTSCW